MKSDKVNVPPFFHVTRFVAHRFARFAEKRETNQQVLSVILAI
jgi:hypothetical protein